ncbi:MAG: TonB-dependent receptor [Thermaurantiacus tibetensis]|uniref:TonB-dependent receptor n=1 Tax=Thermaurantiacus tibetensis TaxID=2759035 RepID=UPI001F39807E|nr:TonB-dependent receptor [Thermaurantiacus tibetensis]
MAPRAMEVARLLGCAATLATAAPVAAQGGGAAPGPQTAAAETAGLADIVVTARRREETLQDIPVAIQAFGSDLIDRRNLTSLERIAAATPQFTVGRASNGAGAQLTMRGVGSSATSIGIEQSVAIVVDNVYYGQGRIINEGFFDLARVEVLKGPQSLFYGKNATAGVVSLTTADPGPEREIIARMGYEFAARQVVGETIVSLPVTDRFGIRLAFRGSKMWGGYYENRAEDSVYTTIDAATFQATTHVAPAAAREQPQEEELIGRATLKWEPTEQLAITVKGSGANNFTIGNGWNYAAVNCVGGFQTNNPAYPCQRDFVIFQNDFPQALANSLPFARPDGQLYNRYKSWQVTGGVTWAAERLTLTSITNYNWNNNRFGCDCDFLGAGVWATEDSSFWSFSQEVRGLTTFEGPLNLMLGGLYQKSGRDFYQAVVFAGSEDSRAAPENRFISYSKLSETDGETVSAYGQLIWNVIPAVELTAGVRYIHETKVSFFTQPYVNAFLTGIFRPQSAAVNGTVFGDQTFNDWSPEFTASWKPKEGFLVYGAYRSAYKSGGFSNSAINSALSNDPAGDMLFDPEKGKGWELGVRTEFLDRTLRVNITGYNFRFTDLQVDYFNPEVFAFVTYNAGQARSKGVETEVSFAPASAPGLLFSGSVNYNVARYENFEAPCFAGQSPAEGCTRFVGGVPFQDLSGRPTAMAPRVTANLGIAYDTEVSRTLKLGANFDWRFSDSYITSTFGDERTRQPAYMVIDAGVRVATIDDRWELALIGKNLGNQFYALGGGPAPLTGANTGLPTAIPGDILGYGSAPRTVQLRAGVRF